MMKQVALIIASIALTLPAFGQDTGEIAKVQAGQSCKGCNLFQADLAYLDAEGVDVSGSRLRQSDMQLSTLDNWNFSGANLSVTNLFGARFNKSNFSNANLQRAVMVGAYFGSSQFDGADLTGANISGADLSIVRGLSQQQLERACGDNSTMLPKGMTVKLCR